MSLACIAMEIQIVSFIRLLSYIMKFKNREGVKSHPVSLGILFERGGA
jgi:hypothetical protein